jgi:phosphohistidine swiveling domain-containing protein
VWLHDGPSAAWPAKARALAEAAVAGLPVPRGIVIPLHAEPDPAAISALSRLVASGPVIARTALVGEDAPTTSAAGLGRSIAHLGALADVVDALAELRKDSEDPFLEFYRGPPHGDDAAIVQRQIMRHRLVVGALLPHGIDYVEVHEAEGEVLATGAAPTFAGRRQRWGDAAASQVGQLFERVRSGFALGPHGLDVEIVVDRAGVAWLVQLRPLTAPLDADGEVFLHAVIDAGQGDRLRGDLTLDGEHNPAPLSPAHAWLMEWLGQQRPRSGDPTTLAGWLYVRTLVRDLDGGERQAALGPVAALQELEQRLIPAARARLRRIDRTLAIAEPADVAAQLDVALEAFLAMIDAYLGVLVPARAAAGRSLAGSGPTPLSTVGRAAFIDVLPAAWDIASPTLAELHRFAAALDVDMAAIDPAHAAVLLGEWDDHFFALGLAPLRRAYLRAGALLDLGDDVFLLSLPELERALLRPGSLSAGLPDARRQRQAAWASLRPPARIEDGWPTPTLRHARLRGLPIGASIEGTVAQREDLADLLARPPEADAIVVMPALTAQAALALQELRVRAVCCEYGGAMSHAALMARELGLSALIGCKGCTEVEDGARARLDTQLGRLWVG